MTRWLHPPEREPASPQERFDPVVEGARHGLSSELSLALWQRARAEPPDSAGRWEVERTRRRFHELAARVAARGARTSSTVGKVTLVGVEIDGVSPGTLNTDELTSRAPGRDTLVAVEARRRRALGETSAPELPVSAKAPAPERATPLPLRAPFGDAMNRLFGLGHTRSIPRDGEQAPQPTTAQQNERHAGPPSGTREQNAFAAARRSRSADMPARVLPAPARPAPHVAVMRSAESAEVDPDATEVVARARRDGAPLDDQMRSRLEASLGARLGHVRVHTGADADSAARALGARAFAIGPDLVFRDGAYDPASRDGQHLIAHEVAHTV